MSYLIIPLLAENGYFLELRQLYKDIIRFHSNVPRETNEMIFKSFKSANYVKVNEYIYIYIYI
jgi:hypothetical protein